LFGDGHGDFLPKLDVGTGHGPYGAAIADLNGDDRPELAIANFDAILVLRNGAYRLPTPISVEDFTAEVMNDGVLLAWRLDAEARRVLRGVLVQRADTQQGPFSTLTAALLPPDANSTYRDASIEPGYDYWYRLWLTGEAGAGEASAPIHVHTAGTFDARTTLGPPLESADGRSVRIRYRVARAGTPVQLSIYDVRGRCVWSLPRTLHAAGDYTRAWDRRDRAGTSVARGMYFVELESGSIAQRRKIALVHR
jgi:hypothetical protein